MTTAGRMVRETFPNFARGGSAGHWMAGAVKPSHKGLFKEKADRAGESTHAYAEEKKDAPGALGKEARLALTFERHRPHKG
jgi:hypothetical protein